MPEARTQFSWGWIGAVGAAALVVVLATLPPLVGPDMRLVLMTAFSGVCHQLAERSPHVAGVQLAVCHRCYGIYLGVLAGALLFPLLRRPLASTAMERHTGRLLLAAALPAAIDWGGDVVGLWVNTTASRVATGALFGLAAGYCLARALAQAGRRTPEARHAPSKAPPPEEAEAFST